MKIIEPDFRIIDPSPDKLKDYIYKKIEKVGRTCYKSENLITEDSAAGFIKRLVENQHGAMLEHASMTVKFIVDRGVSHELVRHRIASFAQESTRYCNYAKDKFGGEVTFVMPYFFDMRSSEYRAWYDVCETAEAYYLDMVRNGIPPEQARCILPNSLKTEIIITANMREWRNILALRAAGMAGVPHPQMRQVMQPLLTMLNDIMPELFGDIYKEMEKRNE